MSARQDKGLTMCSARASTTFRRKVFYVPGYDPFPPRRYRELYRKQSQIQADISGYEIHMAGPLPGRGYGWQASGKIDNRATHTEIEVLVWSDIVQASRPTSILATYRDMVRTAWIYVRTGALFRLMRLRKGPVIAALYPVAALLLQALTAILVGWGVAHIWSSSVGNAIPVIGIAVGICSTFLILRWFAHHDGRFFAYYLMHDFAYSAAEYGAYSTELEHRLHTFREKVSAALDSDLDEVLVVGHSSGAHLSVSVLADLIRQQNVRPGGPKLALMTLGHVVPMLSFLPHAERLRGDLRYLSARKELFWVDVSAPGDGCCFALCDPVAVSGQAGDTKTGPLVFSAAFTQSLTRERWRRLRWRFFRLHFQYLCAFDQPKDYDYFQITAGPLSLRDRYAGRASSKSRIDKTVSKFTSVRP